MQSTSVKTTTQEEIGMVGTLKNACTTTAVARNIMCQHTGKFFTKNQIRCAKSIQAISNTASEDIKSKETSATDDLMTCLQNKEGISSMFLLGVPQDKDAETQGVQKRV